MMPHSTTISFQEWLKDHNGDVSQLLFSWDWSLSASQYTRVPAPTYATTVAEVESTSFSAPLATDADEAQVNEQTCTYDYMGRRATKKVEEITTDAEGNETTAIISNHRFIYRGYLQIGCCDLTRSGHPCLWLITWDPTQPVATRPLAIQKDGTWYTYGRDLTKNICEIFGQNGYIRSTYAYTPFGAVTASGDVGQSIRWSSEYYDSELALVYYNYRHYNPTDGRWINRDPIAEQGGWNLYGFVGNSIIIFCDTKGTLLLKHYINEYSQPKYVNSLAKGKGGKAELDASDIKIYKTKSYIIFWNLYIQGDIKISVIILEKERNNINVYNHEMGHVKMYLEVWNMLVDEINYLEGEHCGECVILAENYASSAFSLAMTQIRMEKELYDYDEYKKNGVRKSSINDRLYEYNRLHAIFNEKIITYNKNGESFYHKCLGKVFKKRSNLYQTIKK